ncbi:hypothetical protein DPMN_089852 [Dreissena polymorpha]|uniref:Uncharacterized protein n=1 Tax=Dreissena polymorpha TaxID=45954 RepID=A0A9D4KYM2_DREPO|nr:hypothetical protein DPMN_089852 [Dreissena polymorpha]
MFVGLLELACPRRPVILHLRGQDRYSSEVSALALRLMREKTSPTQRVHLHCLVVIWIRCLGGRRLSLGATSASLDQLPSSTRYSGQLCEGSL